MESVFIYIVDKVTLEFAVRSIGIEMNEFIAIIT